MFEQLQSSKSHGLVERQRGSGFLGVSFNLFYIASDCICLFVYESD